MPVLMEVLVEHEAWAVHLTWKPRLAPTCCCHGAKVRPQNVQMLQDTCRH